ncbi:hydrogenase expression/formation protein HypE [bacterium]|nr:hydrogenase expression/formation protein HypE [bacterium]
MCPQACWTSPLHSATIRVVIIQARCVNENDTIKLSHGSGGLQMQDLLRARVWPRLDNEWLREQGDAAVLACPAGAQAVFTTDSFVVQPLFFPGGDIGHLSVCGTVNDLAMMGAEPAALSLAFILETGFPVESFDRIVESIAATARAACVAIVTGDTKVVERGHADGMYITTSGLGWKRGAAPTGWRTVEPGDAVIVSGTLGHHGVAVLAARNKLPFATELRTDAAPLNGMVKALLDAHPDVRWLRDPTRGGLAAALNELAEQAGIEVVIDEARVPVSPDVRGAAEVLGLDPLYLANEGRCVVVCPDAAAAGVVACLRAHEHGAGAARIGTVARRATPGRVLMKTLLGGTRIVDMPSGEQMPRIC